MQIESLPGTPRLVSRAEALATPCPVPAAHGVDAWWFRAIPESVPTAGCIQSQGYTLLYVGASPVNERSAETRNLRVRICQDHLKGTAESSTLRQSLGVLLAGYSGYPSRRVGTGKSMTLTSSGESWLNDWMAENARVSWVEDQAPWLLKSSLLASLSLPLNVQGNRRHPFSARLNALRIQAKENARAMPILSR